VTGLFKIGDTVSVTGCGSCEVVSHLGGGGQGEVYRVRWNGHDYAMKWYHSASATQRQRDILQELLRIGTPGPAFLWPLELVDRKGTPGFGYLMPLRPANFKSIEALMAGRINPSFLALIDAAINLVKAFRQLHTKGLCYRDISFGNAFFDPATGGVLVCDNDNIGASNAAYTGILGTPDFMAPELVLGKAKPNIKTDLHSLAVLLFYLLHVGHPLMGRRVLSIKCWDAAARNRMFGESPQFIFDPASNDNEAVDIRQDPTGETGGTAMTYWRLYPSRIKNTFTKAFIDGLTAPDARVTELEWLHALSDLRNRIFRCACQTTNFFDGDVGAEKIAAAPLSSCWRCKKPMHRPWLLKVGNDTIVLNSDTRLHPHHFRNSATGFCDYGMVLAEMTQNPQNHNVWGLRNLSKEKWVVTAPDGIMLDIESGRAMPLRQGIKIGFGASEGSVL
jgi:DNA-binding helix-hairpin-helix protein with protein kinase domain